MHKITNSNSKRYRKAYVLASEYALCHIDIRIELDCRLAANWARDLCESWTTRPTNGRASHAECLSDDRPPGTGILSITAIVSRIPYVLCIPQFVMMIFLIQFKKQMFPDPQFIYTYMGI